MALAILLVGTLALAMTRVYQVDEAQTVYMASVLAKGWKDVLFTSGQLHLFPLALLVRPGWASADVFTAFRLAFWGLFWLNACLVVIAAGIRFRSGAGLRALVLVGTLAPWWAYALECRHDNILITCVLLLWITARRTGAKRREFVFLALGALSLLTQACLFKSIATWAPLTLVLLALEPGTWVRRVSLAAMWALGAAGGWVLASGIRSLAGLNRVASEGPHALGQALELERVLPGHALAQLCLTAPLLAAGMAVLLTYAAREGRKRSLPDIRATAGLPETGLFLIAVLAFLANPTPFPYNLAALSAFAAVPLLALGRPALEPGWIQGHAQGPLILTALVVLQGAPLGIRVADLAAMGNGNQESLMTMAEMFTGPEDPVFDAVGLVPARKGPGSMWFINLTNVNLFKRTPMTATWGDRVPPVILPTYRLGYLQKADHDFIQANYVALRKDFFVLGQVFAQGGEKRAWTCQHSGRYAVLPLGGPERGLEMDGQALGPGIHWIAKGTHMLSIPPEAPCILAWAGPRLQNPPAFQPNEGSTQVCPIPMAL